MASFKPPAHDSKKQGALLRMIAYPFFPIPKPYAIKTVLKQQQDHVLQAHRNRVPAAVAKFVKVAWSGHGKFLYVLNHLVVMGKINIKNEAGLQRKKTIVSIGFISHQLRHDPAKEKTPYCPCLPDSLLALKLQTYWCNNTGGCTSIFVDLPIYVFV